MSIELRYLRLLTHPLLRRWRFGFEESSVRFEVMGTAWKLPSTIWITESVQGAQYWKQKNNSITLLLTRPHLVNLLFANSLLLIYVFQFYPRGTGTIWNKRSRNQTKIRSERRFLRGTCPAYPGFTPSRRYIRFNMWLGLVKYSFCALEENDCYNYPH